MFGVCKITLDVFWNRLLEIQMAPLEAWRTSVRIRFVCRTAESKVSLGIFLALTEAKAIFLKKDINSRHSGNLLHARSGERRQKKALFLLQTGAPSNDRQCFLPGLAVQLPTSRQTKSLDPPQITTDLQTIEASTAGENGSLCLIWF